MLFPVGDTFAHVKVSGFNGLFSGLGMVNGARVNDIRNPTRRAAR